MTMHQAVPSISAARRGRGLGPGAAPDPATRPLIVDVRERDEFDAERVEGVVLLPISEFVARHQELPKDRPLLHAVRRRQPLDVRDDVPAPAAGRRRTRWPDRLRSGRTDVRNVTGGMHRLAHGRPRRSGPAALGARRGRPPRLNSRPPERPARERSGALLQLRGSAARGARATP